MNSSFSRRGFLKLLGAFGGFLGAGMVKLVPEISSNVSNSYGEAYPERLQGELRRRLGELANRDRSFNQLQNYLNKRGFQFREGLVDAVQVKTEEFETEMLMHGLDGLGQGATLFFTTGKIEKEDFSSSFAWIVDEAAYIIQNGEATVLEEATIRMKDVPRLPQEPPLDESTRITFTNVVHADHCACHNEYSACYVWNGLCASLTVGCFLNPVVCPAALIACANATANCFVAQQCGPPC